MAGYIATAGTCIGDITLPSLCALGIASQQLYFELVVVCRKIINKIVKVKRLCSPGLYTLNIQILGMS